MFGTKLRNSLAKLKVLKRDGDKTSQWQTLCTEAEIHAQLLQRNKEHMIQSQNTLFGSGE